MNGPGPLYPFGPDFTDRRVSHFGRGYGAWKGVGASVPRPVRKPTLPPPVQPDDGPPPPWKKSGRR
jgi:hypothetical protein